MNKHFGKTLSPYMVMERCHLKHCRRTRLQVGSGDWDRRSRWLPPLPWNRPLHLKAPGGSSAHIPTVFSLTTHLKSALLAKLDLDWNETKQQTFFFSIFWVLTAAMLASVLEILACYCLSAVPQSFPTGSGWQVERWHWTAARTHLGGPLSLDTPCKHHRTQYSLCALLFIRK